MANTPTIREALEDLGTIIDYPCADNSQELATIRAALEAAEEKIAELQTRLDERESERTNDDGELT